MKPSKQSKQSKQSELLSLLYRAAIKQFLMNHYIERGYFLSAMEEQLEYLFIRDSIDQLRNSMSQEEIIELAKQVGFFNLGGKHRKRFDIVN